MLTSNLPENLLNPSLIDATVIAVLGYAVVFVGLIALLIVLVVMGKAFSAKKEKEIAAVSIPAAASAEAPAPAPAPAPDANLAPGSAGQLKLYDTPPKTAAMLMAIVADKMGKPLNELRFISIKEVK